MTLNSRIESFIQKIEANSKKLKSTADSVNQEQVLESTQQFLEWYGHVEKQLESDQEKAYVDFCEKLNTCLLTLDQLLENLNQVENGLDELGSLYQQVDDKSRGIQQISDRILNEEHNLTETVKQLKLGLEFFDLLDPVTRFFASSGPAVCLEDAFSPMLKRIDEAIEHLETKSNFRDATLYASKYRQCRQKALELTKTCVTNSIRSIQSDIRDRLADISGEIPFNLHESLFYEKFKNASQEAFSLMQELYSRDCTQLIKECVNTFLSCRKQLLMSLLIKQSIEITKDKPLIAAATTSIEYLQAWIQRECGIYSCWFPKFEVEFYNYIDQMCDCFQQKLRPLVLTEAKVDVLCELVLFINEIMPMQNFQHEPGQEWISALQFSMNDLVQDLQQRLVFRSQSFIQTEIVGFKLAKDQASLFIKPLEKKVKTPTNNTKVGSGEFYPTVTKTLYILDTLVKTVNHSVFQQIAQETIEVCCMSLVDAFKNLKTIDSLDALLFMFKNLVYLRQQIQSRFSGLEFIRQESVLSVEQVISQAKDLVQHADFVKIGSFGRNLVSATASPQVTEQSKDGKQMLDDELKRCYEDLILESSQRTLEPVTAFMLKVNAFKITSQNHKSHDFCSENGIMETFSVFSQLLESRFNSFLVRVHDHTSSLGSIGSFNAGNTLFRYVKTHLIESYTEFYNWVHSVKPLCNIVTPQQLEFSVQSSWDSLV